MKNLMLISVLLSVVFSSSIFAKTVPYFNGQKEYLKKCRSCHTRSSSFVSQYTIECWNEIIADEGKKLIDIHAKSNSPEIRDVNEYFKSERYKKKFKYIKAFVLRFAKNGNKNSDNKEKCPTVK